MMVGDVARRSRKVTARDIELFTEMTGDRNPLHYDEDVARASRFGGIIVQGGVTSGLRNAVVAADRVGLAVHGIIVANPEVSSVRDSDRIIGLLDAKTEKAEKGERIEKQLLLTRYDPARAARAEMLKIDDVLEILSVPLLGVIHHRLRVIGQTRGAPLAKAEAGDAIGLDAVFVNRDYTPLSRRRDAEIQKICGSPELSSRRKSRRKRKREVR